MAQTIATTFTAVDKFTAVVSKMTTSTTTFASKAASAFARVERAERSFRNSMQKSLGVLGQLGLGLSLLTIGTTIITSQVEAEKSLASLSAITGVTGKDFEKFAAEVSNVSKVQKMFVGDTAKAFEIIGSAKPELLSNAAAMGTVTNAAILLSKATRDELAVSAANLTATLNQFGLGADKANRVINALAAGSLVGAAAVPLISEAMDKFGTAAAAMNVTVEESIGLVEALADKNIKGAEAGTALRNVLLKMSTAAALPKEALTQLEKFGVSTKVLMNNALPLNTRLKEFSKISGDATALAKVFGTENFVAGQLLLNNVATVDKYTKAVTGTNTASVQAAINSNTLAKKYEALINSFKNATTTTDANNKVINKAKDILGFLADNMETVVAVGAGLVALFVVYKTVMFAASVVTTAYSVGVAIATAAQWLWNAAMAANPIVWFVVAIIALIAVIAAVVYAIYRVVKALLEWMGIFDFIAQKWAALKAAFAAGDILGVFKVIGQTILKWILLPIQLVLQLVSKIPGVIGKSAGAALEKLNNLTGTVNVENTPTGEGKGMLLNPDATIEKVRTERAIKTETKKSMLEIFTNGADATLTGNDPNIKLSPTLGF